MRYTNEKNVLILLGLLKAQNIRRVIVSPGATNVTFVASIQNDPHFILYSAVDERSAAYMACGIASETNEPVVLSCTGATASRNYLPGLTEAFYRKIPVLAVTSTQILAKVGHHIPQVIDRSVLPLDAAKLSVTLPVVKDADDYWECEVKVNKAILELRRHGGGPVHINLPTIYSKNYEIESIPSVRVIKRISLGDDFPSLRAQKIAVFIGSHCLFSEEDTNLIDKFCEVNDAVVFCDHTSSYQGRFRLQFSLPASQRMLDMSQIIPDITIHIGEISGDSFLTKLIGKQVWRVSEDGEIRDTFRKLRFVFEMPERDFFNHYTQEVQNYDRIGYFKQCTELLDELYKNIPVLPFSNIWVASQLASKLPTNSSIHFGILNSLRSWNFFKMPSGVTSFSNVGGFGIDGCVSSFVGASLVNTKKLYFLVLGDLAFFYDMNVLGNRHLGKNLRILIVNNGKGTEFRQFNHTAAQHGNEADDYIAAAGHFGDKSPCLVKSYVEALGFRYMSASSKEHFLEMSEGFLNPEIDDKSIVFEIFTRSEDESDALEAIMSIKRSIKGVAKQVGKNVLGEKGRDRFKRLLGK